MNSIEYLRSKDYKDWKSIREVYLGKDIVAISSNKLFKKLLNSKENIYCIVYKKENEIIGFLIYATYIRSYTGNIVCHIEDIFVKSEYRQKGIGNDLIQHLIFLGKNNNWDYIYWRTNKTNLIAQQLYEKIGKKIDKIFYEIRLK